MSEASIAIILVSLVNMTSAGLMVWTNFFMRRAEAKKTALHLQAAQSTANSVIEIKHSVNSDRDKMMKEIKDLKNHVQDLLVERERVKRKNKKI